MPKTTPSPQARVALLQCETYDQHEVRKKIEQGISLLGGWQTAVRPGEKILLKPNMLAADPPDRAVTTHPSVMQAVAESLLDHGVDLTYGDSPASGTPETVARKSGLAEVAAKLGIPLADFTEGEMTVFTGAFQQRKMMLARGTLECDGIISLPKLKTHALTRLTGAVKNQYGCVVGTNKKKFHARHPLIGHFARMLVDLNMYLQPRLYIMDAVVAMEGKGPRGGNPRKVGALLISADPVALDAAASRLVGLRPDRVPTNSVGQQGGLGEYKEEHIQLLGDDISCLIMKDFDLGMGIPGYAISNAWLRHKMIPRPHIDPAACKKCGLCINACPLRPGALIWPEAGQEYPPIYNYAACIRCYCCQEICPEGAIDLHTPWIGRVLGR